MSSSSVHPSRTTDPQLALKFEGEYKRTVGHKPYVSKADKLTETVRQVEEVFSSLEPEHVEAHKELPGPNPVSITSIKELRDMKLRNVVPKFGPVECYPIPQVESQELGWRALEARPSAAVLLFTRTLSGKAGSEHQ